MSTRIDARRLVCEARIQYRHTSRRVSMRHARVRAPQAALAIKLPIMLRRNFLSVPGLLALRLSRAGETFDLAALEHDRVLKAANRYFAEPPVTVTAASSPRSAGGKHDFFSEGDYWWPDPKNPDGPYIQRDGMTNPDNFVEHRHAMVRLSLIVPALAAAYKFTHDHKYADHAARHLRAWFV